MLRARIALVACPFLMVACSSATEGPSPLPVNTDLSREWPTATPAEQGIDAARLQVAYQVARSQPHLKSLLVVRNGFLVAEEYFTTDDDTSIVIEHCGDVLSGESFRSLRYENTRLSHSTFSNDKT
jgi:hypothetical protein